MGALQVHFAPFSTLASVAGHVFEPLPPVMQHAHPLSVVFPQRLLPPAVLLAPNHARLWDNGWVYDIYAPHALDLSSQEIHSLPAVASDLPPSAPPPTVVEFGDATWSLQSLDDNLSDSASSLGPAWNSAA